MDMRCCIVICGVVNLKRNAGEWKERRSVYTDHRVYVHAVRRSTVNGVCVGRSIAHICTVKGHSSYMHMHMYMYMCMYMCMYMYNQLASHP